MTLQELFKKSEEPLTFEKFTELAGDAKFVDLTDGGYVSKQKFTDTVAQKDSEIQKLTGEISTRDADLKKLHDTLKDVGDVEAAKTAVSELATLRKTYEKERTEHAKQIAQMQYDTAASEFASTLQFTSGAAKRDFVRALKESDLQYKDGKLIGATDFVETYKAENADAFKSAEKKPTITLPTDDNNSGGKKLTLSEQMMLANQQANKD